MTQPAKTFQDLIFWQKAHQFVLAVYRITKEFPNSEIYGFTSQLRLSAVSIPANIAEGFKKRCIADKARFFNIAQGSLEESRYFLWLARDLNYYDCSQALDNIDEVSKLLSAYRRAIVNSK